MKLHERVLGIIDGLKKDYPQAECSLNYEEPYQLLFATRLSAQCTDARVNIVTKELFSRYKTLREIAECEIEELERIVHPCGVFRMKARDIRACANVLLEKHNGRVPDTMEELTALPGVGRKTANLILGDIYGKPAVVADTHCIRISNLLGLCDSKDPKKVEMRLKSIIPPKEQNMLCHRFVWHGRAVCIARSPKCESCSINKYCKHWLKKQEKKSQMSIKAILLDLDGTILNTLEDLTDSVNFALSSLGFPKHSVSKIRAIVGNGVKNLITRALPKSASENDFENCLVAFKQHYEVNKTNKTAPYDGIIEVLAELKKQGYKLAIVSNKHDDAVQGLYSMFFSEYVDFALGNCEELPKKPAPDMVFFALDKLSVKPEESVYIGDSEVDIETAKNSNIPCISVTWGFRDENVLLSAGANIIVHTPGDLPAAIKKL